MRIINTEVINHFFALLQQRHIECHAINIYQNGKILLEKAFKPFDPYQLHPLYSVTKSFTSMAIGFLEEEGKLILDDSWISYFPEYVSYLADEKFQEVTIRHLLTMSLGQDSEIEIVGDDDWVKVVLGKEIVYEPGTVFLYNSYCSHLLSALVTKLTGLSMKDYLRSRLFEPLNIYHFLWEEDLYGRTLGGYGLHLSVHDLMKFGICCLHHGVYEDKQILPASWLSKATSFQMPTANSYPIERSENRQGYGYHFWMCTHGGYRCSGLHGQLCFIQPENDLVIAMQNATTGSQAVLDCLFEAMENVQVHPAPKYELALLKGEAKSTVLAPWLNDVYLAAANYFGIQSIQMLEKDGLLKIRLERNHHLYEITAAYQTWHKQKDQFHGFNTFMTQEGIKDCKDKVSDASFANYAWKTKTTLVVDIREWDHSCGTRLSFEFDQYHLVMRYHVNGLYTMITDTKCIFLK